MESLEAQVSSVCSLPDLHQKEVDQIGVAGGVEVAVGGDLN